MSYHIYIYIYIYIYLKPLYRENTIKINILDFNANIEKDILIY